MKPSFWLERWNSGRIGFHQQEAEPHLVEHFTQPEGSARVFVPLCGKSLDLVWLARQGWEVVGVELSSLACENFFSENLPAEKVTRQSAGAFILYRAGPYAIYCGDYFKLGRVELTGVTAVYDRAALIALPPESRPDYVTHLKAIAQPTTLLLVTLEYPQEKMDGPPFSVGPAEVTRLYGDRFEIERLAARDESAAFEGDPKLRGEKVTEHVFRMRKRG